MKRRAVLQIIQCLVFFSFHLFFSCNDAYDDMIEKFDSQLTTSPKKENSITDSGFTESNMILQGSYVLDKNCTFSLSAPAGGIEYRWEILGNGLGENILLCEKRSFTYLMPGEFSTDDSNFLLLTVIDSTGREYKDTAEIIFR